MEKKSFIDDLTGLYNRRYLHRWIDSELARCKRYDLPLSIALLDLDDFKKINDLRGHFTGDKILIQFSEFLKDGVRGADLVVRYGGDEFVIVFPNTRKQQAGAVIQRILKHLKGKDFEGSSLSSSCGISSFPEAGSDWEILFQVADRRMYQVKRVDKGSICTEEVEAKEFQIPTPYLVGREKEMALFLDYIRGREKRIIIVKGEVGVGKTRLVEEGISNLSDAFLVIGGSYPAMESSPYYAVRSILQNLLSEKEGAVRDVFVEDLSLPQKRMISSFLPEISPSETFSKIAGDRLMLFDTITKFIDLIAERIPLALLFDDLHWASGSTVELLHFLLKSRKEWYPLFGTYRSEEVKDTPFIKELGFLGRENLYKEVPLDILDESSTGEMVSIILNGEASPNLKEFVYKESGGNPFFVEEILKEMKDSGALSKGPRGYKYDETIAFHIPETIEGTIEHKFSLLSEEQQKIVNIAALIGRDFDFPLLRSITGFNEGELYDLLDQLKGFQLILEKESEVYSFKEDVFRKAIIDKILLGKRRKWHGRIATILEKTLPDSHLKFEQLAYHYYKSGDREKIAGYGEKAGDNASSIYAHGEAIRFYKWALMGEMEETHRGEILRKIAGEYAIKGDYEESMRSYGEALKSTPDEKERARVYKELGNTYQELGNYGRALENLKQARKTYSDWQGKYSCDPDIAWVYMQMGKEKSALRSAKRAIRKIEVERFPKEYSVALNTLASINAERGRHKEALDLYEEAREIREGIGYKEGVGSIYNNIAGVYLDMNDLDKAEECYNKALDLYRDTGFKEGETINLYSLGALRLRRNELYRTEDYLRNSLDMAEWMGSIKSKIYPLRLLAFVLNIKGSTEEAISLYKQAEKEAEKTQSPNTLVLTYAGLISTYAKFLKELDKAREYVEKAESLLPEIQSGYTLLNYYLKKARYLLECKGREEGIELIKKKILPLAKKRKDDFVFAKLYSLLAVFYSQKGWKEWGVRYIKNAMEFAEKTKDRSLVAEIHQMAGRLYLNLGMRDEAKKRFTKALRIFQDLQFTWFIQDTDNYLKKLGNVLYFM
ncbi:MAG: diguanylate cyclase [candidate division WOR-3 bacterium]|nr:diguanylate cyclase [candidate division WOR-3 bacterium]